MKNFEIGDVVRSTDGRDRKRVFIVTDIDDSPKYCVAPVVIADGSLRKISARKHKNPAHLEYIASVTESEKEWLFSDLTDEKMLTICKIYDIGQERE